MIKKRINASIETIKSTPEIQRLSENLNVDKRLLEVFEDTLDPIMLRNLRKNLPSRIRPFIGQQIQTLLERNLIKDLSYQIYIKANQEPGENWQRLGDIQPFIGKYLNLNLSHIYASDYRLIRLWVNHELLMSEIGHLQETNRLKQDFQSSREFEVEFYDKPVGFAKLRRLLEERQPLLVRELAEIQWTIQQMV